MSSQGKPASPTIPAGRLMRIEDVAERLAVSRSFAWKLITNGQVPSLRLGRAVRVRPEDLERYIADAASQG